MTKPRRHSFPAIEFIAVLLIEFTAVLLFAAFTWLLLVVTP